MHYKPTHRLVTNKIGTGVSDISHQICIRPQHDRRIRSGTHTFFCHSHHSHEFVPSLYERWMRLRIVQVSILDCLIAARRFWILGARHARMQLIFYQRLVNKLFVQLFNRTASADVPSMSEVKEKKTHTNWRIFLDCYLMVPKKFVNFAQQRHQTSLSSSVTVARLATQMNYSCTAFPHTARTLFWERGRTQESADNDRQCCCCCSLASLSIYLSFFL